MSASSDDLGSAPGVVRMLVDELDVPPRDLTSELARITVMRHRQQRG
jgi:hypothetical protein